jgi:hypothetical protein
MLKFYQFLIPKTIYRKCLEFDCLNNYLECLNFYYFWFETAKNALYCVSQYNFLILQDEDYSKGFWRWCITLRITGILDTNFLVIRIPDDGRTPEILEDCSVLPPRPPPNKSNLHSAHLLATVITDLTNELN